MGVHHTHRHTVDLEPVALEIRVMGMVIHAARWVFTTHTDTP